MPAVRTTRITKAVVVLGAVGRVQRKSTFTHASLHSAQGAGSSGFWRQHAEPRGYLRIPRRDGSHLSPSCGSQRFAPCTAPSISGAPP